MRAKLLDGDPGIPGRRRIERRGTFSHGSLRISSDASVVAIEVTELGGQSERLIDAFAECAEGRCSCPTDEYQKLTSLDVRRGQDEISLRLESKPGTTFDTAEIAHCLEHTLGRSEDPGGG